MYQGCDDDDGDDEDVMMSGRRRRRKKRRNRRGEEVTSTTLQILAITTPSSFLRSDVNDSCKLVLLINCLPIYNCLTFQLITFQSTTNFSASKDKYLP